MTDGPVTVSKGRKPGKKARTHQRERRESRARREAGWFYKVLGGRVPDERNAPPEVRSAAVQIEAWLKAVPPFHRGALSLRFTPREWPKAIVGEFHEFSSLVIRLECALHPATGKTTEELEKASIARIEEAIAANMANIERIKRAAEARENAASELKTVKVHEEPPTPVEVNVTRLEHRAARHVALAIRALGKVRGDVPCAVPRANPPERKEPMPATELPPSSSVHLVPSATELPPACGGEAEDQDAASSREVRTWH